MKPSLDGFSVETRLLRKVTWVLVALAGPLAQADDLKLSVSGPWQIRLELPRAAAGGAPTEVVLQVPPAVETAVVNERYASLPFYQSNSPGWAKGMALRGVKTQETAAKGMLDPGSLQLRTESAPDAPVLTRGEDYGADLEWGTYGRLPQGRIREGQAVFATYRYGQSRLDTVVRTREGQIRLREGVPHVAVPQPPTLAAGEIALANLWLPGRLKQLGTNNLLPILETEYPTVPKLSPSPAERFFPKTFKKLKEGQPVRLLAWGDSVTDASYLPAPARERWQAQFVERLKQRFPAANIELVTEAWGGRNTDSYLGEPPGSPHNYTEKVLAAKPDLIVSEFVNDAGFSPAQVEERYSRLWTDFQGIGAEWIILTPHYVRPDWMGLTRERDIDEDPRPYVAGLRQFAARHEVALADAAKRWGRLWRQGVPYTTLLSNAINHPDPRGMRLFADSLMELFP